VDYASVKAVHVTAVCVSFTLFFLRGLWMISDSPLLKQRWVRIVPHVNDTVLLIAAITLAVMLRQYPLTDAWLTAKVGGLIAYIALGTLAMRPGRTRRTRIAMWLAAQGVFFYIVTVALTHNALPWMAR
jgi:uncharacterized membrane protein SirB2